jgi:hypothetical protein
MSDTTRLIKFAHDTVDLLVLRALVQRASAGRLTPNNS